MFTLRDPGSSKSFGAKQQLIRSLEQSSDRIRAILEPLTDWRIVAEALGATRIAAGGTRGLNPLEIRPAFEHVLERRGEDVSPLNEHRTRRLISSFASLPP